jgi:hypothetical protein
MKFAPTIEFATGLDPSGSAGGRFSLVPGKVSRALSSLSIFASKEKAIVYVYRGRCDIHYGMG